MILLWLAAQAADATALSGFYRSTTMEVGAAIEIEPDGSFDYALDYGAVSEGAGGSWKRDGNRLVLTTTRREGTARDVPLTFMTIDGSALILQRYDRNIRFEREGELQPLPDRNEALEKGN